MRQLLIVAVAALAAPAAFADWGINVNIGTPPYYGYAQPEVVYVERYVPDYDVPRIFMVARYARVRPAMVVDYYRRYPAWGPVCSRFGVPVSVVFGSGYEPGYSAPRYVEPRVYAPPPPAYYYREGPPRGRGHFKHHKHHGHDRD
jgi:hypothetical protein